MGKVGWRWGIPAEVLVEWWILFNLSSNLVASAEGFKYAAGSERESVTERMTPYSGVDTTVHSSLCFGSMIAMPTYR
jgi:hypothetical protein